MSISTAITRVDYQQIISLIASATRRVGLMAPGVTEDIAKALVEKWGALGSDAVCVILDIDPEVDRLGYGTTSAVKILLNYAQSKNTIIRQQRGIRIGVLLIDDSALVYAPIPELIEAGSVNGFFPNGVFLEQIPASLLAEFGWANAEKQAARERVETVSHEQVDEVITKLEQNPPLSFDISRSVRVFNSLFEFVEIEVKGCNIERKTITIPRHLMAFVPDPASRERMRSTYQLVSGSNIISGDEIKRARKKYVDHWLRNLPGYGQVVFRNEKAELQKGVELLKQFILDYKAKVSINLQSELDANRERLGRMLFRAMQQNPTDEWQRWLENFSDDTQLEKWIDNELRKLFGSAEDYLSEMKVTLIFKGVTYEMLNDPHFMEIAQHTIPDLVSAHEEYVAAPVSQKLLF